MTNDLRQSLSDDMPDPNDALLQSIGARLRQARLKAGLSVVEICTLVGCSKRWVYAIEEGQQNFTIQTFRKLLKALNLEFQDVLATDEDDEKKRSTQKLHEIASRMALQVNDVVHSVAELRALTSAKGSIPSREQH